MLWPVMIQLPRESGAEGNSLYPRATVSHPLSMNEEEGSRKIGRASHDRTSFRFLDFLLFRYSDTGPTSGFIAEKIPLNGQSANRFVERGQSDFGCRGNFARSGFGPGKQPGGHVEHDFVPGIDRSGMDAEPAGQIRYKALLPDRRQNDLRFEVGGVFFS